MVAIGGLFVLARFSEAFLLLRAQQMGIALALVPLVMVAMNAAYAASAYPFGALSDRIGPGGLLAGALLVLIAADAVLALATDPAAVVVGVALWGVHLGMSQGVLAAMVAAASPPDLRGTAFGVFNLVAGVATLLASVAAGFMWDAFGAPATFLVGAAFAAAALLVSGVRALGALRRTD